MEKKHYLLIGLGITVYLIFMLFLINSRHGVEIKAEQLAPMITPRQEVGIALMDDLIYIIGGFEDFHQDSDKVEIYDPKKNTWTSADSLPRAIHHPGVAALNGKIYVIGGFSTNGSAFAPLNEVHVYNGDRWVKEKSMPTARGALGVVAHDGKIYAIGGSRANSSLTSVEAFDPLTQKWEVLPDMIVPRDHFSVVSFEEKIMVMGGRDARDCHTNIYRCLTDELFPKNTAAVESFDPVTRTWKREEDLLLPRGALAAVSYGDSIFLFGGEYLGGVNSEFEQYGAKKRLLKSDLTARHGAGSVVVDGYMYIVGGGADYFYSPSGINERVLLSIE